MSDSRTDSTAVNAKETPSTSTDNSLSETIFSAGAFLTVEQAADFLHMSVSSIRAYIRQGTLKAFRVAGKRKVLIARGDLLKLLEPAI